MRPGQETHMGSITRIRDHFDEVQKAKEAEKDEVPLQNKKKGRGILDASQKRKEDVFSGSFSTSRRGGTSALS